MRGRSPDPAPRRMLPLPCGRLVNPLVGPNAEEMQLVCRLDAASVPVEHSHANGPPSAPASAGPIECSICIRERSRDLRFRIDRPAAPPKKLTPSTPTNPENHDKADVRRRPPTITPPPCTHACVVCARHAFLPLLDKVPIQVGPRFVERTHSCDSFCGTTCTHGSFSCKLVVTYRAPQ
jgi:hypothetical protein